MLYKGNDLNLQPWSSDASEGAREHPRATNGAHPHSASREGGGAGPPIRVDETVMACCNDAFEAAEFHGSSDIRIEHLLHALTRVAAAADKLEERGIRVTQLRRETAIAIASRISEPRSGDMSEPRTSDDVAGVLQQAAEQADERDEAASVEDLLRVLLKGGSEALGAALLLRAAADADALEQWRDEPVRRPVPALTQVLPEPEVVQALAHVVERLETLERSMMGQAQEMATALARNFSKRVARTEAVLQRLQEESTRNWSAASERLIALEAMVRAQLQGAEEGGQKHERDLREVYDALVKLGGSHELLSNALNSWRLDNSGDVSIVSNRLEQLEHAALNVLGELSGEVQAMREQLAAPRRRGRFKRWLFGTSSVFGTGSDENDPLPQRLSHAMTRAQEKKS